MPLSNIQVAKYKIAIDREKSKLLLNKEFKTQRSLTLLFGILGIVLAGISFQSCLLFVGTAAFFAFRWKSMESQHVDSLAKIQRYESILSAEP